ncbi:hypothetical protein GW756_00525 [bacterium]|nr:hypothetical protein [bacterium]NCQ54843.1 hypothetical protein [Candidatus Parcubacteria bacterium]NCS66887.1 hypothetical protein [Candidatus Peregrinibacteria bacterium]NCS95833.1 hypothetical protein [bacterium]
MKNYLLLGLSLGLSACAQSPSMSESSNTTLNEPDYIVWEINSNEDAQNPPTVFCLHIEGENRCYTSAQSGCKAAGCKSDKCSAPELLPAAPGLVICNDF